MDLTALIGHPEQLNRDTLFKLRELVARCPYHPVARLLFLQNLFLLHDPTFGEEVRRAALYVPDRRVLHDLVVNGSYSPAPAAPPAPDARSRSSRTATLIDNYLETVPDELEVPRHKPTAADATTDYTAFLLQLDDAPVEEPAVAEPATERHSQLLSTFIETPGRITLKEEPEYTPDVPADAVAGEENYFTETLARIYVRQGRYEKAAEIIRKIHLDYPEKNAYFADQIRFLEKLIANNKHKKQ